MSKHITVPSTCPVCLLQAHLGLHAQLLDAHTSKPLQVGGWVDTQGRPRQPWLQVSNGSHSGNVFERTTQSHTAILTRPGGMQLPCGSSLHAWCSS